MTGVRTTPAERTTYRIREPEFLAAKLRARRMTQSELAELLGVSGATVSRWISGRTPTVPAHTARRLLALLDEPDYAIFETGATVR